MIDGVSPNCSVWSVSFYLSCGLCVYVWGRGGGGDFSTLANLSWAVGEERARGEREEGWASFCPTVCPSSYSECSPPFTLNKLAHNYSMLTLSDTGISLDSWTQSVKSQDSILASSCRLIGCPVSLIITAYM